MIRAVDFSRLAEATAFQPVEPSLFFAKLLAKPVPYTEPHLYSTMGKVEGKSSFKGRLAQSRAGK